MSTPVFHVQLPEKGLKHGDEHAVSLGTHKDFPLVQLLHIDVLINWQVCAIFFK